VIDRARFEYWTGHGATASETVDRLIKKDGKLAAAKAAV
jgi:ribosomal protein S16